MVGVEVGVGPPMIVGVAEESAAAEGGGARVCLVGVGLGAAPAIGSVFGSPLVICRISNAIHPGAGCPATLIWNHWLSSLRAINVTSAFFFKVVITLPVLGAARTLPVVAVTLAITGIEVGVGGGSVGSVTVGGGIVGRTVAVRATVGVAGLPKIPPGFRTATPNMTTAQKSKTTAAIASGIHSRFPPPPRGDDVRMRWAPPNAPGPS